MRRAIPGILVLLLLPASVTLAQQSLAQQPSAQEPSVQQEDPLAAAARQAREEKKQQVKTAKVWDNDNIPKNAGALSVVGQAEPENPAAAGSSSNSGDTTAAAGAEKKIALTPAEQKSVLEQNLAAAKEELQTLQNDFDILQRKHALDQQMYYGKPDYNSDKTGAAALQDEQDQLDAKQQEMEAAQQKVADLQSKLNSANGGNTDTTQQRAATTLVVQPALSFAFSLIVLSLLPRRTEWR